jgi:NAD(P)-dependent dehydrogenase (short-subunit alcohol dehydrogenase family)
MTLTDRGVLITGVKRIGAIVAADLAHAGADVVLSYNRSRIEADATADAITALGRRGFAIHADLSDPDACRRLVEDAVQALGRLDVLINMASVYVATPYDALTDADWDAAINVDLRASHLCTQAAVPHMRRQGAGRVINFSDWISASGRPRYTEYLPYYVAKAGVIGLTEILALELAKDGILVNAVAPGPILPPSGISDAESEAVVKATPLGRWGGEVEVAKAVRFLVETDFVTGDVIRVDGGRHVR